MNLRSVLFLTACLTGTVYADTTRLLPPIPANSPTASLATPADPNHFMFVVCGDNRAAARHQPMPPTAPQVFAEMHLLRPAFCLWTGDAIYGSDETVAEARDEYAAFLAAAAKADTPLFNAPGNHEISGRKELERLYESCLGPLYGSFDYGNTHVIVVDTEETGQKAGVYGAQLEWLRGDLEANRGAANIIVLSHHPLFPKKASAGFTDLANRDELHRLFVSHKVKFVFSGHEHLYYRSVVDGVTYVVTGGGGAPMSGDPEDGGYQHYVVATVNNGDITLAVVEPWRLFIDLGPVAADGSCGAVVSNYQDRDFTAFVEFPTDKLGAAATATATFTYKGNAKLVAARIVPARKPGTTLVEVTLPRSRATQVDLVAGRKS